MKRRRMTHGNWSATTLNACLLLGMLGLAAPRPMAAIPICGGDCDEDGRVRVNELVTVVGAILHDRPVSVCAAADMNENAELAVNEVVIGTNNALMGCPSARVDGLVAELIGEDTPGMAIMVIDHGQILHERGYGLADVEGGVAVTPNTRFFIASVTKPFTALAILMLAERQQLDLDDPVALYLPELARFDDALTIRSMLTHTGGLPDYFDAPEIYARWADLDLSVVEQAFAVLPPAPIADPALFSELLDDGRILTSLGLTAVLEEYGQLLFTPNDAASYSSTGYDLLGGVIERVSGQTYAAFVRDNILVPVGMELSFLLPGDGELDKPDVAKGYGRKGDAFVPYVIPPQEALGSGDIFTTLHDLYLFDQALYGETLVSQTTLGEAFSPHKLNDGSDAGDGLGKFGLGWQLNEIRGERVVQHPGGYAGYTAGFTRFVDRELTIISLSNREDQGIEGIVLLSKLADIYLHPPGTSR